ncbi:MAG TPA: hypothetical protein VND64_03005 [Pirellulales bacterium]|nr:hypothetical protein [Pirellulales bacterium]
MIPPEMFQTVAFFFLLLAMWYFVRAPQRARAANEYQERAQQHIDLASEHIIRSDEHMQKVEALLTRIADSLEKRR